MDLVGFGFVEFVGIFVESFFGIGEDGVGMVGSFNDGFVFFVLFSVFFRFFNYLLNFRVGEIRVGGNGDGLVFVGGFVFGVDVDDGVGVNVEGNFDLGDIMVGRGDVDKLEVVEEFVVMDKFMFILVDFDFDGSLEISGSGEDLRFFGGDGGVVVD